MIPTYLNKESVTKEEILSSISNCLSQVDPRYYNPSFNVMEEIVNVFGELDFAKVKVDIDNLVLMSGKLDQGIKLIVKKHSNEFYQILGFVREMKKMLKASGEQYSFAEISLDSLIVIISSLITGESDDWQLKSIFFSEILSKLRKTQAIYELLQNCDTFLQYDKLYETIDLLMKNEEEHQLFDKEFRQFNLLVNVNLRFNKLNTDITNRLIYYLNCCLLFDEGNCLKTKLDSLIDYFLSSYAKVSIDMEVTQPLIKFINIIQNTLNYSLRDISLLLKKDYDSNHSLLTIEDKLRPSSLIYIIQSLKRYNNPKVLLRYTEDFNRNLILMMTNILKLLSEGYEFVNQKINSVDLSDKTEKIVFLMLIQIPLLICYNSLTKFKSITQYTYSFSKENDIYNLFESVIVLPLDIIQRTVCYSYHSNQGNNDNESEGNINENNNNNEDNNTSLYHLEILYKRKINEMPFITIDCLPITYKIYYDFYVSCQDKLQINFALLKQRLTNYSKQLYQYLETRLCSKKYFDIDSFIFEYDSDTSNFKFINEITKSINQLKRLSIFACGDNYINIMKIVKALFTKLYADTKTFIEKQKKDCIHKSLYTNIYGFLIKYKHDIISKILIDFQYRKYEKEIIKKTASNERDFHKIESVSESLTEFVIDIALTTKQPDQLSLINRNYKLIELLTKFISCTESALIINENFVFDIIRQAMPNEKIDVLLEQVGQIAFESKGKEANNDLSSLILVTLTTFNNMTYCLFQILLLLKIEFISLTIPFIKNLSLRNYALKEPETNVEYFVTSFVNDLLMYNSLFQYNLNEVEYAFVKEDYMKIINEIFIDFLQNTSVNNINHYGINLLIKNYEYIRSKLGNGYEFKQKQFELTIKYFANYARLVNLNEEQFKEQLKVYYDTEPYKENEISQIMILRGSNQITLTIKEMSAIELKGFI